MITNFIAFVCCQLLGIAALIFAFWPYKETDPDIREPYTMMRILAFIFGAIIVLMGIGTVLDFIYGTGMPYHRHHHRY